MVQRHCCCLTGTLGSGLPGSGLGNANQVEHQEQRDEESWNQAQRKHGHGSSRGTVRRKEKGGGAQGHGSNQIRDSQRLPEDEGIAMTRGGELPCREGGGYADEHVAITGGQSEDRGEGSTRLQKKKREANDSPGLRDGQKFRV